MDKNTVFKIQQYLESRNILHIDSSQTKQQQRLDGRVFPLEEHIKGMIYAQLSNQRKWSGIEAHLAEIDAIFFDYNPEKLKETDPHYFKTKLMEIHCGNRGITGQMQNLRKNIETMEMLIQKYGSMDAFVTSADSSEIAEMIYATTSPYKLACIGESLAYEYLRNIGIDCAKPDVHMMRILGSDRLGYSLYGTAKKYEVNEAIKELSAATGLFRADIDYLFWSYCAVDMGGICCAKPKCEQCVIRNDCNHGKKGEK